jgi:hypothetical protein
MEDTLAYKEKQQAEFLVELRANPRINLIRVATPGDCSMAGTVQGVYHKDEVPELPVEGCSRPGGCICTYEPIVEEIVP